MSEDCHNSDKRMYCCTCCGFSSLVPGLLCGCNDDFCRRCKRCASHCSCELVCAGDVDGYNSENERISTSDMLDKVVGRINDYFVAPMVTKVDDEFLKSMKVKWE